MITTLFYVLLAAYCVVSYAVMIFVAFTKLNPKPGWLEKLIIIFAPVSILLMGLHSAWEKLISTGCDHRFRSSEVENLNIEEHLIKCVQCKTSFRDIEKKSGKRLKFQSILGDDKFYKCVKRSVVLMLMVLMIACGSKQDEKQAAAPVWRGDGWELVGDKDGCKLYFKCVDNGNFGCTPVFWSLCIDNNSSVSSK